MNFINQDRLIKLLIADIDGCLVGIRHSAYDLAVVADVVQLNRSSQHDRAVPLLTFLTGRPQPYVDALMQVFDVSLPAIFENGAGLAWRLPYEARLYPKVQEGLEELHSFKRILEEQDDLVIQMGKVASLTVFSRKGRLSLESLFERVCNLKDAHRAHLLLDPAQDCINVLVPGVDKGTGLKWLAEELDIELSQIAGIGDSPGDIVWLRRCTISCAPANASPAVKKNVSWVSPYTDIRATLEFYGHLIQHNRKLLNIDAVPKDESVA